MGAHFITKKSINLALIKSISGIRGTIGGAAGENLTPQDVVECTAAFGYWLQQEGANPRVVLGRDGRISGELVSALVTQTLVSLGFEVIDLDYSTTPTVEIAVPKEQAGAGIVITASHNPKEWNALKFLNHKGEFISKKDGESLLALLDSGAIQFKNVDQLGKHIRKEGYIQKHIDILLNMPMVDVESVKSKGFRVVVDGINSTGSISVPPLLEALGCEVVLLNGVLNGQFAHNPEPLPKNLQDLAAKVLAEKADLGIAVDPDVDRLAFVNEDGSMFGEEYTLVAVADFILSQKKGNTVSNLSSTRALRDVTQKHGGTYFASAVGEVNVVEMMKAQDAVIGGEGNGGIIVPDLHYGRDALAGIALFLTHLAKFGRPMTALRATYPVYKMVKDKIALTPAIDVDALIAALHKKYENEDCNTIDGLKIDFAQGWVHLRKSNTQPIIRVYAEHDSLENAKALVDQMKSDVDHILK